MCCACAVACSAWKCFNISKDNWHKGDTCCDKGTEEDECGRVMPVICCPCPCALVLCFRHGDRETLREELNIRPALPDWIVVCCCLPWFPFLYAAQMERQLRIAGYLKHPEWLISCSENLCCSSRLDKVAFEDAKRNHLEALKTAQSQQSGESITVSINGTAVTMMDSFYLSYVLQQLHSTDGRLTLGSEDLTSGAQSKCDETMNSLGVTESTVLELIGSTLPETGAFTIEPPNPVAPTPDEYCTLPPGSGFCCSKMCACGCTRKAADVPRMVPLDELNYHLLEPPTVVA